MSKFKITVIRTDEYEIEVDEKVWDEKALKDWSGVFTPVNSTEDVAKDFAVAWMRNEDRYFIEGYGYVKQLDAEGNVRSVPYRNKKGKIEDLPEEKFAKGISIHPIYQDEAYETEVELMN